MIYINIIIICILHFLIINPLEKLSFLFYNNNIKNNKIYRPKKISKGNVIFNNLGMSSGHSEIIIILCILLYIKYNFNSKFLIILILLIGLERIISKNHTLFQVIIGYIFGIFYGLLYIKNLYYVYLIIPIIILLMYIQFENNQYNIPKYIDDSLLILIKSKYNINFFIKIIEITFMLLKYILFNNETYILYYNWNILENDMDKLIDKIINTIDIKTIDYIVGIKTGGAIITSYIAKKLNKPYYFIKIKKYNHNCDFNITDEIDKFDKYVNNYDNITKCNICEKINIDITNKNILLLDELIVTGKTISCSIDYLKNDKQVNNIYIASIQSIYKILDNYDIISLYLLKDNKNNLNMYPWGYLN